MLQLCFIVLRNIVFMDYLYNIKWLEWKCCNNTDAILPRFLNNAVAISFFIYDIRWL